MKELLKLQENYIEEPKLSSHNRNRGEHVWNPEDILEYIIIFIPNYNSVKGHL